MRFLVDTNVVSELFRPRPNAGVSAWADRARDIFLSAVTVEEIAYGFAWKPNPRIRSRVDAFLSLWPILPVDEAVALRAGELRGTLQAVGKTRASADMLIAATAQVHALTVVTRNVRDFEDCGIPLLNPFS